MRTVLRRRVSAALAASVALAGAVACSAGKSGVGSHPSDLGGGATSGTGSGNGTGDSSSSAATGNIDVNNGGSPTGDAGCQHIQVKFVPKIPSIFVLVDRSGSMFDSMAWEPLKAGVLSVVQQLQGQVRFGFSAFTGQAGGVCPIFAAVAPALNNFDAISTAYAPLDKLTNPKGETPVGLALPLVEQSLMSAGNDGDKYILFVTDGEPDFCDDGSAVCPVDSTISHLQMLKTKGITTIVFGLKSTLSDISDATLQAFANAGAGQPVALPFGGQAPTAVSVCDSCGGVTGWKADWTTTGRAQDCRSTAATPGTQTLGTYAATDGTALVYRPAAADQAALAAQIASVVQGIKSCTFDLSDVTVNLSLLNQASVAIEGTVVPLSQTDGWRMNNETQLELVGSACTDWNKPDNNKIDFNFPCEIIVPK